jgi:3-hydroxymyristoyl/3-hydroxydecanoyl-(acyl carrier protein) dehydratase
MPRTFLPDVDVLSQDGRRFSAAYHLDKDMPWFSGHFPGIAILPGLGMLALSVHTLRRGLGVSDLRLAQVNKIRFKGVVRPGEQLDVVCELLDGDPELRQTELNARFELSRAEQNIGTGRFVCLRP